MFAPQRVAETPDEQRHDGERRGARFRSSGQVVQREISRRIHAINTVVRRRKRELELACICSQIAQVNPRPIADNIIVRIFRGTIIRQIKVNCCR